jgi:hypothetical protein
VLWSPLRWVERPEGGEDPVRDVVDNATECGTRGFEVGTNRLRIPVVLSTMTTKIEAMVSIAIKAITMPVKARRSE